VKEEKASKNPNMLKTLLTCELVEVLDSESEEFALGTPLANQSLHFSYMFLFERGHRAASSHLYF